MTTAKDLIEHLAAHEHERWSRWQHWVHSQCEELDDGGLKIPAHLVERWERQVNSHYAELPEHEKESDRREVVSILTTLASFAVAP